jgi:hypothetical protein
MYQRLRSSNPRPRSCVTFGQRGDHLFAIAGAAPTLLLVLDDQPSDLPVRLDHRRIDGAVGAGPRRFEDSSDLSIQRLGRAGE